MVRNILSKIRKKKKKFNISERIFLHRRNWQGRLRRSDQGEEQLGLSGVRHQEDRARPQQQAADQENHARGQALVQAQSRKCC